MQIFGLEILCLILDVDGVLFDVDGYLERNIRTAASFARLPLSRLEQYLDDIHAGRIRMKGSLSEMIQTVWPSVEAERAVQFAQKFREEERLHPYPVSHGALATLWHFYAHGLPMALCTSNDDESLKHRLLSGQIERHLFRVVSTIGSGIAKPDPRTVKPIFQTIPVRPDQCLYVGDWYPDLELARRVGMHFAAVLSGFISKEIFLREGVPEHMILARFADVLQVVA
jgi:phosphoglycolate phosphatase-like HAD superfamily hydrolase